MSSATMVALLLIFVLLPVMAFAQQDARQKIDGEFQAKDCFHLKMKKERPWYAIVLETGSGQRVVKTITK